jgi:hypothetical protein
MYLSRGAAKADLQPTMASVFSLQVQINREEKINEKEIAIQMQRLRKDEKPV